MKPDWKDAPEWANYLAMDDDGWWYWYEDSPIKGTCGWDSSGGRVDLAVGAAVWKYTLEYRPQQ